MIYQFKCEEHGLFEVSQSVFSQHKANCPQCGKQAQRVFSLLQWIWSGSLYREDGSRREQNDYGVLKG